MNLSTFTGTIRCPAINDNLDWPSKESLQLPEAARITLQQQEIIQILDETVALGLNVVFFQVKPTSDALYKSTILPWSSYLTGTFGKDPAYDPLQFILEQAHQRNLELHAWFNPYRVSMDMKPSTIEAFENTATGSPSSVYSTHPDWIKTASDRFVIDPGLPLARAWIIEGVMEVVEKYDVDGIHFDDYFYYETATSKLDDDGTFACYGNDFTNKGDWRRNNTLLLITELSEKLRDSKPYLKFGISPSGVWRNKSDDPRGSDTSAGNPHYDNQYADTRLWVLKELVDYIAPQVYWPFTREIVRFDTITKWWANIVHGKNVHLYIGEALYKVGVPSVLEPQWQEGNGVSEIKKQLLWNMDTPEIQGSILFRHLCLRDPSVLPAKEAIKHEIWPFIALIPSMSWKDNRCPQAPTPIRLLAEFESGREADREFVGDTVELSKKPINLTHNVASTRIRLQWEDGAMLFSNACKFIAEEDTNPHQHALYYAIYRFTQDQPIDIDGANCLAIIRHKPDQQQNWFDNSPLREEGIRYCVIALNRNHNESDLCVAITVNGANDTLE